MFSHDTVSESGSEKTVDSQEIRNLVTTSTSTSTSQVPLNSTLINAMPVVYDSQYPNDNSQTRYDANHVNLGNRHMDWNNGYWTPQMQPINQPVQMYQPQIQQLHPTPMYRPDNVPNTQHVEMHHSYR